METSLFALWSELTFMFPNNYFPFLLIFKSPKIPTFLKTSFFAVCSPLRRQGGMTRQPNFSLSIPSAGIPKKYSQGFRKSIPNKPKYSPKQLFGKPTPRKKILTQGFLFCISHNKPVPSIIWQDDCDKKSISQMLVIYSVTYDCPQ